VAVSVSVYDPHVEALLVIVAELAALLGLAAIIVVIGLAATSLALIITASAGRHPRRISVRRLRQLLIVSVVAAGLSLLALQTFALRPALEWGLAKLATTHGYRVSLGDAQLSLLRGGLQLDDLEVQRGDAIAVTVSRVDLDLEWPSLLSDRTQLEHLEIRGVLGRYAPPETKPKERAPRPPRRPFDVQRLELDDLNLVIASDAEPLGHHLRVDTLEIAPLRSDHLIYDLLLASQGQLRIDGHIARIVRTTTETRWSLTELPIAMIGHRLGPPFTALREGAVDLELTLDTAGEPPHAHAQEANLSVHLELHGARLEIPKDLSVRLRLAAVALNTALRLRDRVDVDLRLPIRAEDFRDALNLADTGLQSALTRGLVDALIRSARVRNTAP